LFTINYRVPWKAVYILKLVMRRIGTCKMTVGASKTPYPSMTAGAVFDRALKLWVFLLSVAR
jgi:hypothetical protein